MTDYWFRPKQYGYGATPVTWQGWVLSIGSMFVVVVATMLLLEFGGASVWTPLSIIAIDGLVVIALWRVSRRRTEGEWRWRWGNENRTG